jgi:hypothetical protein
MASITSTVERLDNDMYNHGQDGLKTQFTKFAAAYWQHETDRKTATDRANFRFTIILTIIGLLFALFAGLVGVPPAVQAVRDLLKSDIHWKQLFAATQPLYAQQQSEDAKGLGTQ